MSGDNQAVRGCPPPREHAAKNCRLLGSGSSHQACDPSETRASASERVSRRPEVCHHPPCDQPKRNIVCTYHPMQPRLNSSGLRWVFRSLSQKQVKDSFGLATCTWTACAIEISGCQPKHAKHTALSVNSLGTSAMIGSAVGELDCSGNIPSIGAFFSPENFPTHHIPSLMPELYRACLSMCSNRQKQ